MEAPFLSRGALARVLTSLLKSELTAANPGPGNGLGPLMPRDQWSETMLIGDDSPGNLPCDSLDLLRLSAAVNEMFHLGEAEGEQVLEGGRLGTWLDTIQAAWAGGVRQITFTTSGSTGKPTQCTHAISHLQTEIRFLAEVFADRTRVVPLAPAHHIYGFLFTAMLPDRLGHPPHSADNTETPRVPQDLRSGDLIVSFPERWQWLHRSVPHWPDGVAGVVSTAPCPSVLARGLMDRGLASLTEIYGSSETAGVGLRRWPETRYGLMPHWKIDDIGHAEGAMLTHTSRLQVRVKDHFELHADGTFTLAGRIDAAVQVGGSNVYPARIAALLRDQPGVRDAVVRLGTLAGSGRLKAFVVPQPDCDPTELRAQLEHWARRTLDPAERPKSIAFGDALPRDGMGKDCDWSD